MTTDSHTDPHELFDLCDADGRALGIVKQRQEVHRDGDWHRSAVVWIGTPDGRLIFQRRSVRKDTWPGCFDSSIAGHFGMGESSLGVIMREAEEELGVALEQRHLFPLGVRSVESFQPGTIDRERQDIYLYYAASRALPDYRPHLGEIDALTSLNAHAAAALHAGRVESIWAEVWSVGQRRATWTRINRYTIIPGRAAYITALAEALDLVRAGEHPASTTFPLSPQPDSSR